MGRLLERKLSGIAREDKTMGMFDEIWWDAELPPGLPQDSRLFQTKSLDSCMEYYVVTRAGRLRFVSTGWDHKKPFEGPLDEKGVDIDFHGDMRLVIVAGEFQEFIARFTHGTLEWIRPIDDVPCPIDSARLKLRGT